MSEINWIKLKTNMFGDEKIQLIESMVEGDSILLIWIKLLTLAGKNNGSVYISEGITYSDEMLSVVLKKQQNIVRLALQTLTGFEMIERDDQGIHIINWDKHQNIDGMEKIRQQTKERVKKFRLNRRNVTVTLPVTQSNATDTDTDTDNKNKNKNIKHKTLHLDSVYLSSEEYEKLLEIYETVERRNTGIEILNNYLQASGKKYKSHYHVLIGWVLERVNENAKHKGYGHSGDVKKTSKPIHNGWVSKYNRPNEMQEM